MAKNTTPPSLVELEKLMADRQSQLEVLLRKRDQQEEEVNRIDAEIQDFLKPGSARRKTGQRRPQNSASLRTVLLGVLTKNKKGLSLSDLAQQISDTGYKSHSNNFKNVVYQTLHYTKDVVRDKETGLYRVKK